MKILATGDHHFREGPRWRECLRIHAWIVEQVQAIEPDVFVSCGDVFDASSTPTERLEVARFFRAVAEVCPVLIVRGNHDKALELELLELLDARHSIRVESGAGVHMFEGIAIGAFAWPSRASIANALGAQSGEEIAQLGREALRRVFRGLGDQLRNEAGTGLPTVLVGHAHLTGARVMDHGQPLPFGEQIAVSVEDLELADADAVLLGHIHLAQSWGPESGPVIYTGSPFRNTFGESDPKSITLLETGEWGVANVYTRITTPAAPMILLEDVADLAQLDELTPEELASAEVRLRYTCDADERVATRAHVDRAVEGLGVARLKMEEQVRPSTTVRTPEVAVARTLRDQLLALWTSQGVDVEQRFESLCHKIATLEMDGGAS